MATKTKIDVDDFAKALEIAGAKYELEDAVPEDTKALTTGNMAIDAILGVGGLPLGRNVELYGEESSGKSTLALQTAAELQKRIKADNLDEYIIYYDYENTVDLNYARALGVDTEHKSWKLFQPNTLEQGTNHARALIETGKVRLIIWDSVAEMTPASFFEDDTGKATMAVRARLMSQFLQQTSSTLRTYECTSVFLNHSMVDINVGPGRPGIVKKTTPGGKALKYHASVRIEFTRISHKKSRKFNALTNATDEIVSSSDVKVKIIKNKVADPFRECVVRVRYGQGFDNFWTAVQVLVAHKKLPSSAGYYYFEKLPHLVHEDMDTSKTARRQVHGEDALMQFADERPQWRDLVIKEASELIARSDSSDLNTEADPADKFSLGMGSLLDEED